MKLKLSPKTNQKNDRKLIKNFINQQKKVITHKQIQNSIKNRTKLLLIE